MINERRSFSCKLNSYKYLPEKISDHTIIEPVISAMPGQML